MRRFSFLYHSSTDAKGRPALRSTYATIVAIAILVLSGHVPKLVAETASNGSRFARAVTDSSDSQTIKLIPATSQSVLATLSTSGAPQPPSVNAPGQWLSGESESNTVRDGSFARWRGRPIEIGGTWAAYDSPDHLIGSPSWSIAAGAPFGDVPRMDFAAGGPLSGESWYSASIGVLDSRWGQQLRALRSAWGGRATANMYIRFAHEMNGDWFTWSVSAGDVKYFVAAWHRYYDLLQVNFPGAKLVWSPNDQTSWSYDARDLWPGDQYVDVIGVDSYNRYPWANTSQSFTAKMNSTYANGSPLGLESWRKFAFSHGKPFAVPEWANASVSNGGGGGDAPAFMTLFHKWLVAHGGSGPGAVAYEIMFNVPGFAERYEIFANGEPSEFEPLSAAVYMRLW